MKIRKDSVLLITACVNPKGMIYTKLQDPNIRLEQYKDAILFYLRETTLKIVVVENTDTDMTEFFENYINNSRLEYLTFNGNEYDKTLGKGYGEGLIIDYAFIHSSLIKKCKYVIKISGRHKILNINSLISISELFLSSIKDLVVCEVNRNEKIAVSDFFIASKSFYERKLIKASKLINDSKLVYFEHILYSSVKQSLGNNFQFLYLPLALHQLGQSGSSGQEFQTPTIRSHIKQLVKMFLYMFGIISIK